MNRRGQSTVEYMLYVSVMIIGLLVTAWVFVGPFSQGARDMMQDAGDVMDAGTGTGQNDKR